VPLHTHPVEEAWVVTDGSLTLQVGEDTVNVEANSVVRIPPGVPHAVRNHGPDEVRRSPALRGHRGCQYRPLSAEPLGFEDETRVR
jgi:hypothetical protein